MKYHNDVDISKIEISMWKTLEAFSIHERGGESESLNLLNSMK